jgi:hypothetical protein
VSRLRTRFTLKQLEDRVLRLPELTDDEKRKARNKRKQRRQKDRRRA